MLTSLSTWCFAGSWTAAPHQLGSSSNTVQTTPQYCPPLLDDLHSQVIQRAFRDTSARTSPSTDVDFLMNRQRQEAWPQTFLRFPRRLYCAAMVGTTALQEMSL